MTAQPTGGSLSGEIYPQSSPIGHSNCLSGPPAQSEAVKIHTVNPLADSRWDDLVGCHPRASVFHQSGWLRALARTYGYEPFVLTTSAEGPLQNGIAVCRVSSWITGTRLVSLPFSDHCEPLLDELNGLSQFTDELREECDLHRWRYVELRPLSAILEAKHGLHSNSSYWFHELDLRPSLETLFRGMHKDSVQRKIRRAEREGLTREAGCSERLLEEFYKLLLLTRKRHQLPPQPRIWFANLVECMKDKIQISVARSNGTPIGAMLTLRHRACVVYKYGCSDERLHNLGAMPFLFWKLIEESKALGAEQLDLGRSDIHNEGLITFKDRLGASRKRLTYYRHAETARGGAALQDSRAVRQFFSYLPEAVASAAGKVLYRHMG